MRMDDHLPSPASSPLPHDQQTHNQTARFLQFYHQQQQQHGGFIHPALTRYSAAAAAAAAAVGALPAHLQAHEQFRSRSGSLLSLGSTASSHRPERSPSRESSCSQESLPRASPVGYMPESPSPSPPSESSKLFGLLKGTAQSPYTGLFSKPQDVPRRRSPSRHHSGSGSLANDDVTRKKSSPSFAMNHLKLNGNGNHHPFNGAHPHSHFPHPHPHLAAHLLPPRPPQHLLPPPSSASSSEKDKLDATMAEYVRRSQAYLDSRADAIRRSNSISESRLSRPSNNRRRTISNRTATATSNGHSNGATLDDDDAPMDLSVKRPRCATLSGFSDVRRFTPPPLDPMSSASLAMSHNGVAMSGSDGYHSNSLELKRKYSQLRAMTSQFSTPHPVKPMKPDLEPISPPLRPPSSDTFPPQRSPSRDSRAPSRASLGSQGSNDDGSILRSILCGEATASSNASELLSGPSRPPSARSDLSTGMALSPSVNVSEPASPANSIVSRLMAGSPSSLEGNLRVCIAKKTLFPVRARITNYLVQIVKFARMQSGFSSLNSADQLALLVATWAHLLVVIMAENHFEFAVCPDAGAMDEDIAGGGGVPSLEVPTMKGVETVQNFIQTLQGLNLEAAETENLKAIVLFEAGKYYPTPFPPPNSP